VHHHRRDPDIDLLDECSRIEKTVNKALHFTSLDAPKVKADVRIERKIMEVQHYICSSSFPNSIQELLSAHGFYVESLPEVHHETNRIHGAFSFRVTKGPDTLRILGVEDSGTFGFHMVDDPSDDPATTGASDQFYDEVEELMLRNGADHGDIEEL
jgi:hypothetical protein